MKNTPHVSEPLTMLHYDGKTAVFPNAQEAESALTAALREDIGGYHQVTLTQANGRITTHPTFVDWFCMH